MSEQPSLGPAEVYECYLIRAIADPWAHVLLELASPKTARLLDVPITNVDVAFPLSNFDELYTLLSEAGFQSIKITSRSLSIRMPEPERFVQFTILWAQPRPCQRLHLWMLLSASLLWAK